MTVEYIRYRIADPERRAAFEKAYAAAAPHLYAAPQCLGYELSRGVEEPEHYVLRIEWSSVEDHEHGFRRGPHFPPFFAHVGPYARDVEEMRHYERTLLVDKHRR
ncbi:antibiotic biosynthesis monooxygenase [Streptomyces sp. NPDC049555]|uniref:putative quinol monooxygenase n=1 Tax=unclassified Streptomyces TaxID=2593676 RepID=UPI00341F1CA3